MAKSWWPYAALFAVASGFALWYSFDDYERARYFAITIGVPHTILAGASLLQLAL